MITISFLEFFNAFQNAIDYYYDQVDDYDSLWDWLTEEYTMYNDMDKIDQIIFENDYKYTEFILRFS